MSYITAIGTANPKNKFSQNALAAFMIKTMQLDYEGSRKLSAIFKASGIETRYSVLEDYGRDENFSFYPNTPDFEPFPSTEKRLMVFRDEALTLSVQAVEQALANYRHLEKSAITHLIVVCCTGMYAPGLDIDLVKHLELPTTIQRTCITFMGCYAAFNALKVADAFCKTDKKAKVLIVCTELCSLHFQKQFTNDNLLANALFADGAAAVIMEAESESKIKLKPEVFHNDLLPNGEKDMAWTIGDAGFEMKLSTYVPDIIKQGIQKLTDSLLSKISKEIADIDYFVIHPGGKKILTTIEQELGLSHIQNIHAYAVLKNFGNMSSPSVLFVLHEVFKRLTHLDHNKLILSLAFGPGLTLESVVMKVETEDQ